MSKQILMYMKTIKKTQKKLDLKSCNCIICDFKMQTYLNTYCGSIDIVSTYGKIRANDIQTGKFSAKKK